MQFFFFFFCSTQRITPIRIRCRLMAKNIIPQNFELIDECKIAGDTYIYGRLPKNEITEMEKNWISPCRTSRRACFSPSLPIIISFFQIDSQLKIAIHFGWINSHLLREFDFIFFFCSFASRLQAVCKSSTRQTADASKMNEKKKNERKTCSKAQ